MIAAGSTMLLAEPPHLKPHLWFVLTDPFGQPPQVVAVMLRTVKSYTDTTVILQAGDHPFIRHPSSVHYSTARAFKITAIDRTIASGHCHLRQPATAQLLETLRKGFAESPYTVNAVRDLCKGRF
jgi:hypothetical protein